MSIAFRLLWLSIANTSRNKTGGRGFGRGCSGRRFWIRLRNRIWIVRALWASTWPEHAL